MINVSKELFIIGNESKELISYLNEDPFAVGIGLEEKWAVSISRCVYGIPLLLTLKKLERELYRKKFKDSLETPQKFLEELERGIKECRKSITDEEILRESIKRINQAVIEEIVHSYGDVGHKPIYRIEYKNKDEETKILSLLKELNLQTRSTYLFQNFIDGKGKTIRRMLEIKPKRRDLSYIKMWESLIERFLIPRLPKEIKISRWVRYEYRNESDLKEFDALLDELGKFGLSTKRT